MSCHVFVNFWCNTWSITTSSPNERTRKLVKKYPLIEISSAVHPKVRYLLNDSATHIPAVWRSIPWWHRWRGRGWGGRRGRPCWTVLSLPTAGTARSQSLRDTPTAPAVNRKPLNLPNWKTLKVHSHCVFFSDCNCDSSYHNKWVVQDSMEVRLWEHHHLLNSPL